MVSKPPCQTHSNLVYLLLISAVSLCLIFAITMYENAHDPDWWKHVGIKHDRSSKRGGGGGAADDNTVVLLDDGNMFVAPNRHQHANDKAGKSVVLSEAQQQQQQQQQHHASGGKDARQFPIQDGRPLNGRFAESRKLIDVSLLRNGSHFIADYDAEGTPTPTCAPVAADGKTKKVFDYIDVTSNHSRWVGKWLSHHPYVAMIPEFLTDAECAEMVATASKQLFRSQVAPHKNSAEQAVNEVRTSSQAWLSPTFGVAKTVVERIMELLPQFDPRAHEELQILRYDKGQKYDSHNDYFDPRFYGPQPNNRAVTVFLYLTDVDEGGYTQFPRAGGRPSPMEFKSCDKGLRVKPIKRALALFYDMDCYAQLDETSLHGGCAPVKGTKWGGTLWIRYPMR